MDGKELTRKMAKAGKLICVDSGEYSDYQVEGFFVVLQDFDPLYELAKYLESKPEQGSRYNFEKEGYLAALVAQGLLLEISYGTLFLGEYGDPETVEFRP